METFTCFDCGKDKPVSGYGGTGYATLPGGNKVCYDCCAVRDKQFMRDNGKIVMYLSKNKTTGQYEVTNWPGTLKLNVTYSKQGRHNIARTQHHVYFGFEEQAWHGVQYGNNTEICLCHKLKERK